MLDAGGREERRPRVLRRRSGSDDRFRIEGEYRCCDHVSTAAKAGVAGRLRFIVILIRTRSFGRDVALVRLQQIAGEHFRCHEEQQKHRRKPEQQGQDLHHPHSATAGVERGRKRRDYGPDDSKREDEPDQRSDNPDPQSDPQIRLS